VPLYLAHWNRQHLSVGEVISVTTDPLSETAAQQWALVEMGEHGAHPVSASGWAAWNRANHIDAWWCIDAISVAQYDLRRYDNEWYLIRTYSRIEGSGPSLDDRDSVATWATEVLKMKAHLGLLTDWEEGPSSVDSRAIILRI
jgi:hypothetical protein